MTVPSAPSNAATDKLHRTALGVPDLVFFVVAASAPLTAVAGGQAATYLVTGNKGVPLLFVPLAIVLGVFAVGYAAMSHHVADAGAFYTYVARGLGKIPGVGVAFVALFSYNTVQIGVYGLFGVATAGFMSDKLGITLDWYWWCLIFGAVIAALGVLQVDLNSKVLAVALTLEVLVVALFDLAILADPGPEGLDGAGWSLGQATGTGMGAALTFCVASFVGFESAAIYSEEAKDPKRTVARATFIAVGIIGVLYAVSSWLVSVAAGPSTIVDPAALVKAGFTTPDGAAPDPTTVLFVTGASRLGAFWGDAASLLFCTSLFAALLALHNNVSRYTFALGREGVFPSVFGRVSARTGAPVNGSLAQTALAFVVVTAFALADADPVLKLFTWLTNIGAIGFLLLLSVTSFAVVAFFRRAPELDASPWRTRIAPLLAGVVLLVFLVLAVANFNVLITSAPDAPVDTMTIVLPLLLLGGAVGGMLLAARLRTSKPEVYARIGAPTAVEEGA